MSPPALHPRRSLPPGLVMSRWAAPDGWPLRRFDYPSAGRRGSLLLLGGRGDFIEKYLDAIHHWHERGWGLSGFDWRGQGGSGRLLDDPAICHLDSMAPLLADLAAFVAEWRAASPGPHGIVAHSMGGHLALRHLAADPAAADALVLSSPMLGIRVGRLPAAPLRWIAAGAVARGRAAERVWRKDPGNVPGRMTSCPERIADKIWWKETHPEIASGGPSWGWVRAAFASIAELDRADLSRVRTPVLILGSRRDPIVRVDAMVRTARRLANAQLHLINAGGHELLREADLLRQALLGRIDDFLDQALDWTSQPQQPT